MSRLLFAAAVVAAVLCTTHAHACDTCMCALNPKRAAGADESAGALITTPTAATLGDGHGAIGFSFEHQRYNSFPAEYAHSLHHQGHDIHGKNHEEIYQASLGYGLTKDWDVYVVMPVASRTSIQVHEHGALGRGERAVGAGDLRLLTKYRMFDEAGVQGAALFGLEAPTGETSDKDQSGNKFEPELQPGSGSWDVTGGMALSGHPVPRLTLATGAQYTYRGEGAQEFKFGDVVKYDVGAAYALVPSAPGRPGLSTSLELQTQWARRDRNRADHKVADSGGTTMLLSPGLTASFGDVAAYVAFPVPVYQNLGGEHEELKYEVIGGAAWHF